MTASKTVTVNRSFYGAALWVLVSVFPLALFASDQTSPSTASSSAPTIVELRFESDAPIDEEALREVLPIKSGSTLTAESLNRSLQLLGNIGIFKTVHADTQPVAEGVVLSFSLERREIVNGVTFRGYHYFSKRELEQVVRLRLGNPLTQSGVDRAVVRIRRKYIEQGFDAVRVAPELREFSPGEVNVIFIIDEGEPLVVEEIVVEGEPPDDDFEVHDYVTFTAGDQLIQAEVEESSRRLREAIRKWGYYEGRVSSRWERAGGRRGKVIFELRPGPKVQIDFEGLERFQSEDLLDEIELESRLIVTHGTWRELARRISDRYRREGYFFAAIDLSVEEGDPKLIHFSIDEGPRVLVSQLDFRGNVSIDEADLSDVVATHPPSWFPWWHGALVQNLIDEDLGRLRSYYRSEGFADVLIEAPEIDFDETRRQALVEFVIQEGLRTRIQEIEFSGFPESDAEFPDLLSHVGEALDPRKIEADRLRLRRYLSEQGFENADLQWQSTAWRDGDVDQASLMFFAMPGEAYRLGKIIVQNSYDTRWAPIVDEVPLSKGAPLDHEALLRAQRNIYRLGLFRSVTLTPIESETDPQERDVLIRVNEKPAGKFRWGVGFNTRDGFRGSGEISHANLQGMARRLSLRGFVSQEPDRATPNQYLANLGFREPQIARSGVSWQSNLIAQRSERDFDRFSLQRYAGVTRIESLLTSVVRVGFEAQLEQAKVFDVPNNAPSDIAQGFRDEGDFLTIGIGPYLVIENLDDPFLPNKGSLSLLRVLYAPGFDSRFVKLEAQHRHYLPITSWLRFVYRLRGGWANSIGNQGQVPIRQRFFLGGRSSVRGFKENSLGAVGSSGEPYGGDLSLNASAELRFPLLWGFQGVMFSDVGGLYLLDRHVSSDDLRRSIGLGLRYNTPVGPLSLDYGFKLDRRSSESIGEIHFSIGAGG